VFYKKIYPTIDGEHFVYDPHVNDSERFLIPVSV